MEVSANGIAFIKKEEGLRLTSYKDGAGKWTIGFGSRNRGNYPHSISSITAEEFLRQDLRSVVNNLMKMLKVEVTQHEFDALASWIFNIGGTAARTSTLIRKLNENVPRETVAAELLRWRYITLEDGTKVIDKGLVFRRERERQLFLKAK